MSSLWKALKNWVRAHDVSIVLTILTILAVLVYLAPTILVSIRPGEVGVLWSRFGEGTVTTHHSGKDFRSRIETDASGNPTNLNETHKLPSVDGLHPYREGMRLKFPWDEIYIYDIRMQEKQHEYDVLASDGLDMQVVISIRWKPIEADIAKLHRDIGPDYINKLIIPIVGSHAREQIGQFRADELYSAKRLEIQKAILERVKKEMAAEFYPAEDRESFVIVENVLIRSIKLPEIVKMAIQKKVEQKHMADAYVYRLEREQQEAKRKEIEARGIERFQQIIHGSISEQYLKWKGIDATLELARSNNAKIVVIGTGDGDLPIILGGLDSPNVPAVPYDKDSAQPKMNDSRISGDSDDVTRDTDMTFDIEASKGDLANKDGSDRSGNYRQ